jgi:hypothetical protein
MIGAIERSDRLFREGNGGGEAVGDLSELGFFVIIKTESAIPDVRQ